MTKHFRIDCAGSSFITQILENFTDVGYTNNKVCPAEHVKRIKGEYYWMKTYPYGVNERAIKHDIEVPVGKLFFLIPRTKQRPGRYRKSNDYLKNYNITDFFINFFHRLF